MIPFSGNRHLKKHSNRIKMILIFPYIFVKTFWISLPINAKKNLLQHLFSCEAYLWSSIWSLTVEVSFFFIDLCRFSIDSIVDAPPSGPENVPKPGLLPYRSPLSAVSSTCQEITWDKCYESVCLALFTASLTKKCSLKLCTRQMAMSSQWDKCHKIDMNSSKSNSYIWSLVGPATEGTPSMHSSWWEHRGACAGCRSVESHLFMEGGFVCE